MTKQRLEFRVAQSEVLMFISLFVLTCSSILIFIISIKQNPIDYRIICVNMFIAITTYLIYGYNLMCKRLLSASEYT